MEKVGRYVAALLIVFAVMSIPPVLATDGQSTTTQNALSHQFAVAANITQSSKAVIVVANTNDYNVIAIGDMIAAHEKAPMLITPKDKLTPMLIEELQQMMKYGGLKDAIVVGVGKNASTMADLISKVSVPGVNLTVTRVIAPNPYELSVRASVYEFSNSTSAVVTDANIPGDLAKGLMISITDNIPILYEQLPYDSLNATLHLLGVKTVYVTPAVDAVLQTNLTDAGYTVNTSWNGLDMTLPISDLLAKSQPAKNVTFVVGSVDDFIRCASVVGVNSSIIVTASKDNLGTNASDYLKSATPALTIIVGNTSHVSSGVALDIAAATGKKVERMFYANDIEQVNRLGLLEDAYVYPVIYATYSKMYNNRFKYEFKNIGFSNAVSYGDYALKVEFTKQSGEFVNCSTTPIFQNDTVVVFYFTNTIYPYRYDTLEFSVTPGTNFTAYPHITYNALTLSGAMISINSYVDAFIGKINQMTNWIKSEFEKFFGVIKSYVPLPGLAQTVVASVILFLILWTIVGGIVYAVKAYVIKSAITTPLVYGPVGWILGKRGGYA